MKIIEAPLAGVLLIEPTLHADGRGRLLETWHEVGYAALGIAGPFAQDNLSLSRKGVLRGLHIQVPEPQGKLVHAITGAIFDVAVDVRSGSPNFGQWFGAMLSADDHRQMWVPPGFAHGFCVLSDEAAIAYKCTAGYIAGGQRSLRWDDPDIAIAWPVRSPTLSAADASAPRLQDSEFASPARSARG